jgi:23S rRNA pseudouridine2605 synthase
MGLEVNRLIRLAYGPFQLGNLKRGQTSKVTGKVLREQLGEQEAGTVSGAGGVPRNPRGRTGTKKQEAKK